MHKIKSCPCCQGKNVDMTTPRVAIICSSCGVRTEWHETEKQAIETWNFRGFPIKKTDYPQERG